MAGVKVAGPVVAERAERQQRHPDQQGDGDEHGEQQLFAVAQKQLQFQPELGGQHGRHLGRARVRGEGARSESIGTGHDRSSRPVEVEEYVFEAALLHSHIGGEHVRVGRTTPSRWPAPADRCAPRPGTRRGRSRWPCSSPAARRISRDRSSLRGALNRSWFSAPLWVSSAGVPVATATPWSMITIRSASSSASARWWVVSTTVTPSRRSASINSHTTIRAWASIPAVGSSRNTSSGRPTTAQASARRCCWPPDSRR